MQLVHGATEASGAFKVKSLSLKTYTRYALVSVIDEYLTGGAQLSTQQHLKIRTLKHAWNAMVAKF